MIDGLIPAPDLEVDGRSGEVRMPYAAVLGLLGRPNREPASHEVDVAWAFVAAGGGGFALWNEKDGPAYTGRGTVEQVEVWSLGFSDDLQYHGENRELARRVFGPALDLEA